MLADIVGSIMISLKLVKLRALSAAAICDPRAFSCVSENTIVHLPQRRGYEYYRWTWILPLEFVVPISDYNSPFPRCCRYFFSETAVRVRVRSRVEREFAGASRSRLGVEREIRTMIRCGRYRRGRCHRRNAIPKQRRREGGVCHPRVFASGLKIAGAFFRYTGRRAASVARFDTDTGQRYSVSANGEPVQGPRNATSALHTSARLRGLPRVRARTVNTSPARAGGGTRDIKRSCTER